MNAYVKGGSRHLKYSKGFPWLWRCFGIQGFGAQVLEFVEPKQGLMFMVSKDAKRLIFILFQVFLNDPQIKVKKNSKTLWQHTKNDHKERINACQKEKSSTRQLKNSSSSCVPWVTKAMISYFGVEPHLKNKFQSGYHCKAQNWNFCINSF